MKKNLFNLFLDKIFKVPLWTKQVLFVKLADELEKNNCDLDMLIKERNIFATIIPTVTFDGMVEYQQRKCGLDDNIYNFLKYCQEGQSIIEISVNTFLSIEEIAKLYEFCVEQKFLEQPLSNNLKAMVGFISGKFRVGEYFRQINKITVEQLEIAVKKYEELINSGEPIKFCQVLIKLDFIKEKDYKALLILKEEAQKRFILDYNKVPQPELVFKDKTQEMQSDIEILKAENAKLRQKMSNLLELMKGGKSAI